MDEFSDNAEGMTFEKISLVQELFIGNVRNLFPLVVSLLNGFEAVLIGTVCGYFNAKDSLVGVYILSLSVLVGREFQSNFKTLLLIIVMRTRNEGVEVVIGCLLSWYVKFCARDRLQVAQKCEQFIECQVWLLRIRG